MTCPIFELSDQEITTINGNFLTLDIFTLELKSLISQLSLPDDVAKTRITHAFSRVDGALDNLRPLVTSLFELQGRDIRVEK